MGGGGIGDELGWNPIAHQFPHGQARALLPGTRLARKDLLNAAVSHAGTDDAQCRAVTRGGQ